jgi:hypothetical protein
MKRKRSKTEAARRHRKMLRKLPKWKIVPYKWVVLL